MVATKESIKNLTPGNPAAGISSTDKYVQQKKAEAEAWNEIIDVDKELTELLSFGKELLKDKKLSSAQKVSVWKCLFEKLADKVMPPAAKEEVSKTAPINITNMPARMLPKDKAKK